MKNGIILAASLLIGVLILIAFLFISAQYGDVFRIQQNRLDTWAIHNIPIWAEFALSLATCVIAITVSFLPMRFRIFFFGVIVMLVLVAISMPALDKLPDPWNDVLYLLFLLCIGIMFVRLRLGLAPALRSWRKSKGMNPDEFRLI